MRRFRRILGGLVLLAAAAGVVPLAAAPPAGAGRTFGGSPLDDVLYWAQRERRCGLTTNQLAALMLAPTFPETGAPVTQAPSPMTLSRWDDQPRLHAFGDRTRYRQAFWHPGIGPWQFDEAGLGAPLTAAQRIDTFVEAAQAAHTMADRWCTTPTKAYVWAPWAGCGNGVCGEIYATLYRAASDELRNVAADAAVGSRGGMQRRRCTGPGHPGAFTCWRVDPSRAQGFAGFTAPGFGPAPISAPFYVYAAGGNEYRHWLQADTGYDTGIWASRPLGTNARSSLVWRRGQPLSDVTGGATAGSGFTDVPGGAWYREGLDWAVGRGVVAGYPDGTFRPQHSVNRAQAVAWLWATAGSPAAAGTPSFSDVPSGAWYRPALSWATRAGIVSGHPDGRFRPGRVVNRAQFVAMLWHHAQDPPTWGRDGFGDVPDSAWYAPAVAWAASRGYVDGDARFRPRAELTRAQGVSWLHAAASG